MPIDTNLARDPAAAHWERRARLLAAEINAGWWLSSWLPTALVIGIARGSPAPRSAAQDQPPGQSDDEKQHHRDAQHTNE